MVPVEVREMALTGVNANNNYRSHHFISIFELALSIASAACLLSDTCSGYRFGLQDTRGVHYKGAEPKRNLQAVIEIRMVSEIEEQIRKARSGWYEVGNRTEIVTDHGTDVVTDHGTDIVKSEVMRALGYPRPVSVEAFRTPAPSLLVEVSQWLAARLEPEARLAGGALTPDQRVAFVRDATAFFMSRINVKLNARRVYGADGWAVRELLKVATLLHGALAAPPPPALPAPFNSDVHRQYDLTTKLSEIKQARQLATEITAQGAFLYDLLDKEPNNKMFRERALARPLEMATMEAALRRAAEDAAARAAAQRDALEALASSEAALDAKLERRRAELQRAEMRLHTVHKIKPVYQGELTALETILQELWEQYVLRYRCVEALKHQLSQLETAQAEALEEQRAAILQLIHKYEAEDVLGALTDSDELESSDEQRELSQAQAVRPPTRPRTRLRIKTAGGNGESRAFGSMAARVALDEPERSDSDTDLSDDLYGGLGNAEAAGRWSRAAGRPRPSTRTLTAAGPRRRSEDDFADLVQGVDGSPADDSLGSSDETELQAAAPAPAPASRRSAGVRAPTALSDNEF